METNYNLSTKKEVNNRDGLKYITRHLKKHTFLLVITTVLLLISNTIGQYFIPRLIQKAIDIDIPSGEMQNIQNTVLIALLFLVGYAISSYLRVRLTGTMGQKMLFNVRNEIFRKIQNLPTQFISDNPTGDLIQRLTGNVDGINQFLSEGLVQILQIFFSSAIILTAMFILNWQVALISIAGSFLVIIFLVIQGKLVEKPIAQSLNKEGLITAKTQETLDGFLAIKTLNQENSWNKQFDNLTNEYYGISKKVIAISSTSDSFLTMITILATAATLLYSLNLLDQGILSLGTVILFNTYTQSLFRSLNNISRIWQSMKTGIASAYRLDEIIKLDNNITSPNNAYAPQKINGEIEFRDVDFGYNENEVVLSDIDFVADAGKTIAIVGPTGGGKTTFVNLMARLYDVNNGEILVDDRNVKEWDLDVLRKNIGYLIQDTFLFEDTILNNLKYDNLPVTEGEALEMFKFLGAEDFVNKLPKKLHTKIESESDNISSGQRQIIALARILLRHPKILILDEATARIDTKSEKMLQKAIEKASENITTFVIAHRLSTIFNADKIILIKDNTILEQGSHDELIKRKGFYFDMYSKFVGK